MSQNSTDTLSINFTGSMRTNNELLIIKFIDDVKELFAEWQETVQITSLNIAVHDNRNYEVKEDPK
jgi:hypothetical protein